MGADERPNVILIMCDDMGYEGVSAYGSPSYKTPHLDRLASEGLLFNHCYSQPICTPSRVQIMTGVYNHRNYIKFGLLDPKAITFGNVMQDAGYETTIAGKWQLGGNANTVRSLGFESHCLWQLDGRDSRYWNPRIMQDGKLLTGLEKSFGPDVTCKFVTDFIAKKRDKPFFIYYPMCLPHWPFVPTPDSPLGGSRERIGKYDGQNGGVEYFDDMVAYIDVLIGRIDKQLEISGVRDNTLLLFTCDNGCATNIVSLMGDRKINGGKGSMPDAGTHVALVASWPKLLKDRKPTNALVDFTDMLPTITEIAGAKLKDEQNVDGRSFLPVLKGTSEGVRDWVFCHYSRNGLPDEPATEAALKKLVAQQQKQRDAKQMGRYARNHEYKLYDDGRFYNVANDVLEKTDLKVGKAPEAAEAIRTMLQKVHDAQGEWTPYDDKRASEKKKTPKKQAKEKAAR